MPKLTVCILTFNSIRTLARCLEPALQIADELVVVDSGSSDGTLDYLRQQGISPLHRRYDTHAIQMNYAIAQSSNDWVLCLDSDEFLDAETLERLQAIKATLDDAGHAYRITRHWYVLGQEVRAIYPVSSPDTPVRLFNRRQVRFNDQPVDDKPTGFASSEVIPGRVQHDTFYSLDEIFGKLNGYTSRLIRHRSPKASLWRIFLSPVAAFGKWYLRKGAWRDGRIGLVTAAYAALYTFLKYLKAWGVAHGLPLDKPGS